MSDLSDMDLMPFGIHKGKHMMHVPASYFHWLWTKGGMSKEKTPVADYIRKSLSALKEDYPDGIWD